jgi:hypothetical protein
MRAHSMFCRRLVVCLAAVGALVINATVVDPQTHAQTTPTTNQGPQFGNWGPGAPPPAPQLSAPSPQAPGGYAAPGPQVPPPNWGGCNWNLSGPWRITGTQTTPWNYTYTARINVIQFGSWLQIQQPEDNIAYYGRCNGNTINLDVYSGGQFIGYEQGTLRGGPYSGDQRVKAHYTTWVPGFTRGNETWHRW